MDHVHGIDGTPEGKDRLIPVADDHHRAILGKNDRGRDRVGVLAFVEQDAIVATRQVRLRKLEQLEIAVMGHGNVLAAEILHGLPSEPAPLQGLSDICLGDRVRHMVRLEVGIRGEQKARDSRHQDTGKADLDAEGAGEVARAQVAQLTGVLEATAERPRKGVSGAAFDVLGELALGFSLERLRVGEVQDALRGTHQGVLPQGERLAGTRAGLDHQATDGAVDRGKLFVRSLAHLDPFHPFQFRRA